MSAFFQLYMNCMRIDRFGGIWLGIFLKKIADYLGGSIYLDIPAVCHNKRVRSVFKNLRSELEGKVLKEALKD